MRSQFESPLLRIRRSNPLGERCGDDYAPRATYCPRGGYSPALDVWHSWPEQNLHEHLRTYVDRLVGVQVNDVREHERSWCDRVLPGEGRNVCTPIIAALLEAGESPPIPIGNCGLKTA
jgi:hypothetical protein